MLVFCRNSQLAADPNVDVRSDADDLVRVFAFCRIKPVKACAEDAYVVNDFDIGFCISAQAAEVPARANVIPTMLNAGEQAYSFNWISRVDRDPLKVIFEEWQSRCCFL